MQIQLRQRVGSGIAVLGLSLLATAGAFTVAAPAHADVQTAPVCNNLHAGQDPAACHTGGPYGEVDWEVTGGELVLHVTGAEGMGWSDLRVCAPYGAPADGADCQPNDAGAGLLATDLYSVEMTSPSGATADGDDGKTYKFEPCGSEFVVRVPASALAAAPSNWWWAIHLAPGGCAGGATGTHEAFGRVTGTIPPGDDETPGGDEETPAGDEVAPGGEEVSVAGQEETRAAIPVTGGQPSTQPPTDVIGERFNDPAPALSPQVTPTLPLTGTNPSELLAFAGLALFLGGVAITFGRPATDR